MAVQQNGLGHEFSTHCIIWPGLLLAYGQDNGLQALGDAGFAPRILSLVGLSALMEVQYLGTAANKI
jgi:hypothetical protein